MEKLKKRWGISSTGQVLLILLVFSITGSSALFVARPLMEYLGITRLNFTSDFLWGGISYYALRILIVFPTYQILLVCYGWLFGQFEFFWNFEKNMLARFGLMRVKK